jgi:O-acetylhomoserine (thiol)-lyase
MKLESIALHHGYESEKTTKSATTPIYQTTSFTFDDTKHGADLFDLKVEGNIYTRIMNPTNGVLEQRVAEMEGWNCCLVSCLWYGCNYLCYSVHYENGR